MEPGTGRPRHLRSTTASQGRPLHVRHAAGSGVETPAAFGASAPAGADSKVQPNRDPPDRAIAMIFNGLAAPAFGQPSDSDLFGFRCVISPNNNLGPTPTLPIRHITPIHLKKQ